MRYEFVCNRVFPKCTEKILAEKREDALRQAQAHIQSHHNVDEMTHDLLANLESATRSLRV